jgi:hypothetical protein
LLLAELVTSETFKLEDVHLLLTSNLLIVCFFFVGSIGFGNLPVVDKSLDVVLQTVTKDK